jgi:hypothetical protein
LLDYRNAPSGIVDHHGDFILPSGEILSGIVVSDGFGFDLLIGSSKAFGSQFDELFSATKMTTAYLALLVIIAYGTVKATISSTVERDTSL